MSGSRSSSPQQRTGRAHRARRAARPAGGGVGHLRHVRVPVRDGGYLSAALFYPERLAGAIAGRDTLAPSDRVPALLEYHPYRKDDSSAGRWAAHHYLAARDYVSVQLDVGGTGDSPGAAGDEYTPREHENGYDAVEWLAAQPWCSGRVGMWGTSYAGFTAIQVAMLRPPSLRAIAPHAATDDRYTDDVLYYGGCLMALDALPYPLSQLALDALPPNPQHAGADWVDRWRERLGKTPWLLHWLRHQVRDAFWQQGSLRTDYDAVQCPVFLLDGWHDGYVAATLRVFRELQARGVPVRALVGPWTHSRPHESPVGPRVDALHEMVRWFDRWLKDAAAEDEPPLTVYVQRSHPPARFPRRIPGTWRYERQWPPVRVQDRAYALAPGGALAAGPGPPPSFCDRLRHDPTVGTEGPFWCPIEPPFGLAGDLRPDEGRSLVYETVPLPAPLELLGAPVLVLHAAATSSVAFVVATLADVAPDGRSTFISRGALNATHRDRPAVPDPHADPAPLAPGEVYELRLALRDTAWRLAAGHRLRLSVATAAWPVVWPSPEPSELRLYGGPAHPSRLLIPTAPAASSAGVRPRLRRAPALAETARSEGNEARWEVARDELEGAVTVRTTLASTVVPQTPEPIRLAARQEVEATAWAADPGRARVAGTQHYRLERPELVADATADMRLESTADTIRAEVDLRVTRDGQLFFECAWQESFPRRLL